MKKIIVFLAVLFSFAFGKPYVAFDKDALFGKTDEKRSSNFKIGTLFEGIENLYSYANFYPLQFESENDKNIGKNDLELFIDLFETIRKEKIDEKLQGQDKIYFDLYEARLFVMAHNFDMPGFAERADVAYQKLLPQDKNGKIRTEYAEFLGNSASTDRAISEFQTAIKEGSHSAHYGLSIAYLTQGKRDESLKEMQTYIEKFPKDEHAKKMLDIIKTAEIKIQDIKNALNLPQNIQFDKKTFTKKFENQQLAQYYLQNEEGFKWSELITVFYSTTNNTDAFIDVLKKIYENNGNSNYDVEKINENKTFMSEIFKPIKNNEIFNRYEGDLKIFEIKECGLVAVFYAITFDKNEDENKITKILNSKKAQFLKNYPKIECKR